MKNTPVLFALSALLVSGSALARAPRLQVDLESPKGEGSHLSLTLDGKASPFGEALSKARLSGSTDADAARLRKAWDEVTRSGGIYTITVDTDEGHFNVLERNGDAVIEKTEAASPDKKLTVRVPAEAMEALLAGSGDKLDFDGALRILQQRGKHEAIAVEGVDGGKVRVWID